MSHAHRRLLMWLDEALCFIALYLAVAFIIGHTILFLERLADQIRTFLRPKKRTP